MNGCPLPVVINSGSGNQGLTITMPVLLYAEENQVDHDSLLRALAIANLMSIHQKRFIGSLSCLLRCHQRCLCGSGGHLLAPGRQL